MSASGRPELTAALEAEALPSAGYIVLIVLSCVIATFGLLTNSPAVVIGAMLVSPLMSPILGVGLAIVLGRGHLLGVALATLLLGVGLAVAAAAGLMGLVSQWTAALLEDLPNEVLARTQPTLFDLGIALAGGAAGAYARTHPQLSSALPGVAIATALMPPVCVVGIGLARGDTPVALGALLLFAANFAAISAAAATVFYLFGFRRAGPRRGLGPLPRGFVLSGALLLGVALPLGGITARTVTEAREQRAIWAVIDEAVRAGLPTTVRGEARLVRVDRHDQGARVQLRAVVTSPAMPERAVVEAAQRAVAGYLGKPVELLLFISPVTRLDAVAPPAPPATSATTRTPAGSGPSRPILVLPTAVPLPSPTAVPTAVAAAPPP